MYVNQFSLAVFAWFSRRRLPPVSDHLSFTKGGRLREIWLYTDQRVQWKNYKARMHKTTLASAFPDSNVSSTFSLLFRVRFLSFNSVVFSLSIFQELRDVTFDVVARKSNDGSHHPPTYPSLKLTFCPKWQESVNVVLGEGYVGRFPETFNDDPRVAWLERTTKKNVLNK